MNFMFPQFHRPWLPSILLFGSLAASAGFSVRASAEEASKIKMQVDSKYADSLIKIYAAEGYSFTNNFLRENLLLNVNGEEFRYRPMLGETYRIAVAKGKKSAIDRAVKEATLDFVQSRRFVLHLDLALQTLPAHSGKVYRGVTNGEFLAGLNAGDYFMDPSYVSTSKKESVAEVFTSRLSKAEQEANGLGASDRGPILEINAVGRNGRDISRLNEYEDEVLFARETIFRVDSLERWPADKGGKLKRVVLTEWHSDDAKTYHDVRQKLVNAQNAKVLAEAYPQSDLVGTPTVTVKSDAKGKAIASFSPSFRTWNTFDRKLAKTIRDYEIKNRPYDKVKVAEDDLFPGQ